MKISLSNDAFYEKNIVTKKKVNETVAFYMEHYHEQEFKQSKVKRCIFSDGHLNNIIIIVQFCYKLISKCTEVIKGG